MKLKTVLIAIVIIACMTSAKLLQKTNFTGTWVMNMSKSDIGNLDPNHAAPKLIKVDQKNNFLVLTRTFGNGNPTTENYSFDEKAIDTVLGEVKKNSSIKWSQDEKEFTVSSFYTVTQEGRVPWNYTKTEVYSLSADGNTLQLNRVTVFPDRTEKAKAVYDKK